MRYSFSAVLMTVISLILAGCMPGHYRANPNLHSVAPAIKTVVLLEPDIKIYEVSAGGVQEEVKEWSVQGTTNVAQAITAKLAERSVTVKLLKRDDQTHAAEIKEILALYDPVVWSIFQHTYAPATQFKDKLACFDYSIGSIDTLLQKEGADALIIVNGADTVATKGKVAVDVLRVLTGVPLQEPTWLMLALSGKNGDILWFDVSSGSSDFRRPDRSAVFVATLLKAFPELGK